jgi:hypothetical protein
VTGANTSSAIVISAPAFQRLENVSVTGNNGGSTNGAGISSTGDITLNPGTTISGNITTGDGGGIFNQQGGVSRVTVNTGSSVTGNMASDGGGIFNEGTVVRNGGSVSGNTPNDCVNASDGASC